MRLRPTILLALLLSTAAISGCADDDDNGDSGAAAEEAPVIGATGPVGHAYEKRGFSQEAVGRIGTPEDPAGRKGYLITDDVATTADFLTLVLNDVDEYWTAEFLAAGLPDPNAGNHWVSPVQPDSVIQCGAPALVDQAAAFYCPITDTIYISQKVADGIINGDGTALGRSGPLMGGDFAVAYVLAHEYGHNLQAELGKPLHKMAQRELQADCFAGLWSRWAEAKGYLETGDALEAVNLAFFLGDSFVEPSGKPTKKNPDPHGSPAQRVEAFNLGFRGGNFGPCYDLYP